MNKQDWEGLFSLLHELEIDQLRSLNDAELAWVPSLEGMTKFRAAAKVVKALLLTDPEEEYLLRIAWLYCWILSYKGVEPWRLYQLEGPYALYDYRKVLERFAEELRNRRCDVTLEWNLRDGAVYACLLTKDHVYGSLEYRPVYMAIWRGKPLLGVCIPKGTSTRRVLGALDVVMNHGSAKRLPVTGDDLNTALRQATRLLASAGESGSCGVCQESISTVEDLERHENECDDKKNEFTYQCSNCSYTCKWGSEITRHEETHKSKKRVCEVCKQAFDCKQILKKHMATHGGKQMFECSGTSSTPEEDVDSNHSESSNEEMQDASFRRAAVLSRKRIDSRHRTSPRRRSAATPAPYVTKRGRLRGSVSLP